MHRLTIASSAIVLLWVFIIGVCSTPDIGIKRDYQDDYPDLISYTGVLVFNAKPDGTNPVTDLSDALIVGLCAKAFDEMRSSPGNDAKPRAMAALAVGHEVYFASSVSGGRQITLGIGRDFRERPQILVVAAGAARIAGGHHRIGGCCGEINIMDIYFNRNKNLNFAGKWARIVVWATKDGETNIFNPCSTPTNGYGCGDFLKAISNPDDPKQPLKDENLRVIAKQTNRDNGWPDGVTFSYQPVRMSLEDKEACDIIWKDPYDPDAPDGM